MSPVAKLSIKWFLIGMAIYVACGVVEYFWFPGSKMMSEPPPYGAAFFTLMTMLPGVIREAMAAGARQQRESIASAIS